MIDTEHTDNAICPYCGYEDPDAWDIDLGHQIEGDGETDCPACSRAYSVSRHVTITYTTKKIGE